MHGPVPPHYFCAFRASRINRSCGVCGAGHLGEVFVVFSASHSNSVYEVFHEGS